MRALNSITTIEGSNDRYHNKQVMMKIDKKCKTTPAITRGNHSHRACRTICDRDQNEINGSTRFYTKSSNQGTFQIGDQAAHRRVRVNKTYIFIRFLLEYQVIKDLS